MIEVQFYNRKLDGKLGEALGSEGRQRLDGRLGVHSAVQEAFTRAYNLRNVQRYEAFAILKGGKPVTQAVTLPRYWEM